MNYEKIIKEIVEMIKNNIEVYYRNSSRGLKKLREYCRKKGKGEVIESIELKEMTKEVIEDLKKRYLYDFRDIE